MASTRRERMSGESARRSARTKMGRAMSSVREAAAKSSSRRDSGWRIRRFGRGAWVGVGLPEAVVAAAAELGEALFEGVGDVESARREWHFFELRIFLQRVLALVRVRVVRRRLRGPAWARVLARGAGWGRVRRACGFGREHASDDLVDGVAADDAAAVEQVTVPQRA